jgi:threonine aldolase
VTVETNIVAFEVADAPAFCAALESEGVLMGALSPRRVRAVTHLDVDAAGIETALAAAARALG